MEKGLGREGETAIIQFYEVGRGCTSRGSKIEQEEEEELFFRSFSLSINRPHRAANRPTEYFFLFFGRRGKYRRHGVQEWPNEHILQ